MRYGEYKKYLRMGYGEYKKLLRMTEDMLYVKYALKVKVKKGKGKTDE